MTTSSDITTNVGKVRLIIGDTDITDAVFTDEELEVFLTIQSNNLNRAAADALEAWAAKYAANPDQEKIGDYAYTAKITDKMLKLATRLRETDEASPVFEWSEPDLTGLTDDDE